MRFPAYLHHGMFCVEGYIVDVPHYANRRVHVMIDTGAETSVCIGGDDGKHTVCLLDGKREYCIDDVFFISPQKEGEPMFDNLVLLGMNFLARVNSVRFSLRPHKRYFEIDPRVHKRSKPVDVQLNKGPNRGRQFNQLMRKGHVVPLLEMLYVVDPDCECVKDDSCPRSYDVVGVLDTGSAVTTQNTGKRWGKDDTVPGASIDRWDGKRVRMNALPDSCVGVGSDVVRVDVQIPTTKYSNLSFIGTDMIQGMGALTIMNMGRMRDGKPPRVYVG